MPEVKISRFATLPFVPEASNIMRLLKIAVLSNLQSPIHIVAFERISVIWGSTKHVDHLNSGVFSYDTFLWCKTSIDFQL